MLIVCYSYTKKNVNNIQQNNDDKLRECLILEVNYLQEREEVINISQVKSMNDVFCYSAIKKRF